MAEAVMMKKCPVCKMTVNEKSACPICQNTITYEPYVVSKNEKYVFNKYLFMYLLRKSWFSLLCAAIVAVIIIWKFEYMNELVILPIILVSSSLLVSFTERIFVQFYKKLSVAIFKDVIEVRLMAMKYSTGIFAIVAMLLIFISSLY